MRLRHASNAINRSIAEAREHDQTYSHRHDIVMCVATLSNLVSAVVEEKGLKCIASRRGRSRTNTRVRVRILFDAKHARCVA